MENEKSKPAGIIQPAFIYRQFHDTPFSQFLVSCLNKY
jgi:hypothetical protein